jgi:hypothetical protein
MNSEVTENMKCCSKCGITKNIDKFIKNRNICKDCNNIKRKEKYNNDEQHRLSVIQNAISYKSKKRIEIKKRKEELLGIGNKQCKYCLEIKSNDNFRHNRLKCKDCEREEPFDKLRRYVRARIYNSLKRNKTKNTIKYLGCNIKEYIAWISYEIDYYTFENYGKEWHIDHVIPLSRFNLEDEEQQLIAFNWRNTMPLSVKENLSKNNKLILPQIEAHFKKLIEYHTKFEIEMPQLFIDLFAKHLVAGTPLEISLPLTTGNDCEELG